MLELRNPRMPLPPHLEAKFYGYVVQVMVNAEAAIAAYEERLYKACCGNEELPELPSELAEMEKRANALWLGICQNEGALRLAQECGAWNKTLTEHLQRALCQKRRELDKLCVDVVTTGYRLGYRAQLMRYGERFVVEIEQRRAI